MAFERELATARRIARSAGQIALGYAAEGVDAEYKPDHTPVTAADRACEEHISRELALAFPEDGLLGEEGSRAEARSGRRWIVDPIDGTRDFLRGLPTWGNLIALEADGEVAVGVCHFPATGRVYSAARGGGAFCDERPIRVSAVHDRSSAVLGLTGFQAVGRRPFGPHLLDFMSGFWSVRSFGGCQDAMHVASGRMDAWIEVTAAAWDLAPLKVIAEEAGARFFNFDGGHSIYGGNAVICVPPLEADLRAFVGAA
jgi:histidinol-phosphatase